MHFIKWVAKTVPLIVFAAACGPHMPTPPSELAVQPLSGGGHLTWKDNSDNETQFMIERKVGGGEFILLATVPFDTTQYHDAPVVAGTLHTYRVMAMGSGGHSGGAASYSNEASFTP